MRHYFHILMVCILAAGVSATPRAADKSVQSLQTILNDADYSLINPARSDVSPGGFIVANKKHASYNPLPPGVTFAPDPFSSSIYSSTATSSFTLEALVNGISKIFGGGASVSRNNQLTVKQINASGQKVDPNTVIANSAVQKQLKTWLSDKKANYKVYMVVLTLSTTDISINGGKSTDVAAAFGGSLPTCPAASGSSSTADKNAGTVTGNVSSGSGTTAASANPAPATSKGAAATNTNSTTSNPSTPSGTVKVCMSSDNSVGLSTTTPLVFAASVTPVTLGDDGSLSVSPVSEVQNTKGGVHKAGTHVSTLPSSVDWDPKRAEPGFTSSVK